MPLLGYAFDAGAGAIRPLRGIPGAAVLGDVLDAGFPMASAVMAPQQNFALALAADGQPRLVSFGAGGAAVPLEGAMATPDRMVLAHRTPPHSCFRMDERRS